MNKETAVDIYVSSGNTNAGLFFSERYIFLHAIFRRCESILNILRRNNKGTKTQPMFSEPEIPLNLGLELANQLD